MESATPTPRTAAFAALGLAQQASDLLRREAARAIDQALAVVLVGEGDEVEHLDAQPIGEDLEGARGGSGAAVLDVREVALGAELALEGQLLAGEARGFAQPADAD